jgi:tetratricopeptide (TPR) repeat protein
MNSLLLIAALAFSQEEPAAVVPPDVESSEPAEEAQVPEAPKEEAKAAVVEAAKEEPAKEEPKTVEVAAPAEEQKVVEAPKAAIKPSPKADELAFLKEGLEDANQDVRAAALTDLKAFSIRVPTAEAASLVAHTLTRAGDPAEAVVSWLRLFHEFPEARESQGRAAFNELVERKFGKKLKPALANLQEVKGKDASERLTNLAWALSASAAEFLYQPGVELARRLPPSDKVQWSLAQLHAKKEMAADALLAYRKLLALYPTSSLRPEAQFALAEIYSEQLRDYRRGVKAYVDVADLYPESGQAPLALTRAAELYSAKLKEYGSAVSLYERLIKHDAKQAKPYLAMAQIQRSLMRLPEEAIATYKRLGTPEAHRLAADTARKDLKNYNLEVDLRKLAGEAEDFYAAAEIEEAELKIIDKAIETYREVAAKFGTHKLAKKASDRAAKLEAKKSR